MFYGSPNDAISFFQQFHLPSYVNPADFFMEIINVSYEMDADAKRGRLDKVALAWNESMEKVV
jgi:hypothetical protein